MAQSALQAFVSRLPQWPELRHQLAATHSPDQILAIAQQHGFCFSISELRQASRALAADHWPWGGKGSEVRHAFFADRGQ